MADHTESLSQIIELVRTRRAVTRPELAKTTDLGRAVVLQRVDEALGAGILREGGEALSTGGRPSKVLEIRGEAGTVVAAVFGASRVHVALSDVSGRLIASEFLEWDVARGPEQSLALLLASVERMRSEGDMAPLWGAAIGLPSPVDFNLGRVVSPPIMPGWHDYPVRDRIQSELNVPVWVDNDVNLMTLGTWNELREAATGNALLIKVGTGIGAGLISGGRLHRGARGAAGDIGHITAVEQSNVQCRCGKFGCLEAFAGGWALARDGREAAVTGSSPYLAGTAAKGVQLGLDDITQGAATGDRVCVELVMRSATLVGAKLADLISMFNPASVFIAGSLARVGPLFIDTLRETVMRRSLSSATDELLFSRVPLGHNEGALGAAWLALDEIFRPAMLGQWIDHGSPRGLAAPHAAPTPSRRLRAAAIGPDVELTPTFSALPIELDT